MVRELIAQFEALDDPRCDRKVEHKLVDVLAVAVCAVIAETQGKRRYAGRDDTFMAKLIGGRSRASALGSRTGRP
jgi:hypothetical protein